MAKPWVHAESSARRFGGTPEDYMPVHNFMDSSKTAVADNRHRVLTHNAWFIGPDGPLERAFGPFITNSNGKKIATRTIGEQHILEDFGGFIPTAADYIEHLANVDWFTNGKGSKPRSVQQLKEVRHDD